MSTTLPAPATGAGADAGAVGGAGTSMDLQAAADRLAAMPRSWAPSSSELLAEESGRHHAFAGHDPNESDASKRDANTGRGCQDVLQAFDGPRPSLADLDRVLDELAANDAQLATLHADRAVLLARAAGLAEALEVDLLAQDDPTARRAPSARRLELARRAVTAETATTLHLGEHAAGHLTDHAVTLADKAPATLTALRDGRLSWTHATAITKHLADLTPEEAAAVERSVLAAVLDVNTGTVSCTPAQVSRKTARARETAHPTPADVRHTEATQQRAVFLDDGHDGMAWLVAHLPAPLAHAAYDRLTRTARQLTDSTPGRDITVSSEQRTLAQARADILAALLLDDGTLDRDTPSATGADTRIPEGDPVDSAPADKGPADTTRFESSQHERSTLVNLARSIRPQVTVTVPVLTLLGITDAPAVLDGHVPVDAETARQLTALAPSLRRILTHPETGTVLSVGRTTYTVPADLKALVRERDATCRFPGCTHPAARADLDHTTAWTHGGTTSASNLAALCRRHHVLKHQTRWQVTPGQTTDRGGTLEWTSPTGRRHVTRPEPVETTRHRRLPTGSWVPDHDSSVRPDDGSPADAAHDPPF